MELTDRKKQILKIVVEGYIAAAEPVGSKAIVEKMPGKISSATVRNELAELEEMGYLEQPHTSAGRIPSAQGYRLYVNELMEKRTLPQEEEDKINASLSGPMKQLDQVMSKAGQMVSTLVGYPAYTVADHKSEVTIRRFELIAVDAASFIAVVMLSDSRVKSQLMQLQLAVEGENLPEMSHLLNTHFTGISPKEMNQRLMSLSEQVSGQWFLPLNQVIEYAPMQLLIGPDNVDEALQDSSVVIASYDIGENMRGLVGVVGPTRMDYAAVAARLSYFAESLSRMFGKQQLPPGEENNKA